MGRKKIKYVIDAMEEAKLPVKKQWSREIQREILFRINEPRYHRPSWINALIQGSSDPKVQVTSQPYSPEKIEEKRRTTDEWNQAGMELLELIQRWADEDEAQT